MENSIFDVISSTPIPYTPIPLIPCKMFNPPLIVSAISASVSVLCAFVLLFLIGRKFFSLGSCTFMFVSLTVADMINAGGYLFGVVTYYADSSGPMPYAHCNSTILCVLQSFVTTWASMSSFLWTIIIEIACFLFVWHHRQFQVAFRWKIILSFICWGFPFGITVVAASLHVLGFDGSQTSAGWCWIASCIEQSPDDNFQETNHLLWMLMAGKLWEIIAYLTISNLIFLEAFQYYRSRQYFLNQFSCTEEEDTIPIDRHTQFDSSLSIDNNAQFRKVKLLFWIPVAMIVARLWGTLRFVILASVTLSNKHVSWVGQLNEVLLYMQGIGDCSQATCNLILVTVFQLRARSFSCQQNGSQRLENEGT